MIMPFRWTLLVVLVTPIITGYAQQENPGSSPTLSVELRDGSRLIGTPGIPAIPVSSSIGKMDVPLAHVATILFADERAVTVTMTNQDRLSGTHSLNNVGLKTKFGDLTIDPILLKKITCLKSPESATIPDGLVLWNRLESEDDVKESRVGPGGRYNAGRFREGKFGKGVELTSQESFGVTFPLEIANPEAGCIEFWAKMENVPTSLSTMDYLSLISSRDDIGNFGAILYFNPNDGAANGGLCARWVWCSAGTGSFGSWSLNRALGTDMVSEWHHFAVVWDKAGLACAQNGSRHLAAFVDGTLNTESWTPNNPPPPMPMKPIKGQLGLMWQNRPSGGRVTYDNLKIWNYAKTDFSDRNEE